MRNVVSMSKLRPKIAAGLTILALGGLAGLALTHPQPSPQMTQAQIARAPAGHAAPQVGVGDDDGGVGADD
jgi:hypothetical protein